MLTHATLISWKQKVYYTELLGNTCLRSVMNTLKDPSEPHSCNGKKNTPHKRSLSTKLFQQRFQVIKIWQTIIIIIIRRRRRRIRITLFMSHVYLAEYRGSTNWGDRKSNQHKSNQLKCWFLVRGENRSTQGKTSWSRVENQQTQPTYDVQSGNQTWATLVEGQCSHHCANTAP